MNSQTANFSRFAVLRINIHYNALKRDIVLGHFELARELSEKATNDGVPVHADY
jgi:hypothetical protein